MIYARKKVIQDLKRDIHKQKEKTKISKSRYNKTLPRLKKKKRRPNTDVEMRKIAIAIG